MARLMMRLYCGAVMVGTVVAFAYVFAVPPESLRTTRDGVPHMSPPVVNPVTGEAVGLDVLVRHYRGEP